MDNPNERSSGAQLVERDGRLAIMRDVPLLVCLECGERRVLPEIVEQLEIEFMRLLQTGAEVAIGRYVGS